MGRIRRIRHSEVGTRDERIMLRMGLISVMFGFLALAAFSATPAAVKMSSSVKTTLHSYAKPILPRSLMATDSDSQFAEYNFVTAKDLKFMSIESSRKLDEADCALEHEECGEPGAEAPDLLACLVDEEFEFACCIRENEDSIFEEAVECIVKNGDICRADELCVAELIPGSGVGAECLQEFELRGGIALYLFLLVYLFIALAIVCDDYFSYSLDMLGDLLGLSSDVKGATFAAIGSSAPELFVSLADNVIANPPKSVGVGTIVGSAIFNILVIIGASAVVAGMSHGSLPLDWRPLMRDSAFYVISICALIGVAVSNDEAENYEGGILVILYMLYLVFMVYNHRIFAKVDTWLGIVAVEEPGKDLEEAAEVKKEEEEKATEPAVAVLNTEEGKADKPYMRQQSAQSAASNFTFGSPSRRNLKRGGTLPRERRDSVTSNIGGGQLEVREEDLVNGPYFANLYWPLYDPNADLDEDEQKNAPPPDCLTRWFGGGPRMWLRRFYFVLVFPLNLLFRLTIPDARYDLFKEDKDGVTNKRRIGYWLEFIMCIVHIAVLSHFLVFSAAKFGCLVGIAPSIMGLTILAAGTSVPDMITSIILTRNGEGDAAVANSIGSNVFDILIGLGLPWFIAGFVYGGSLVATDDIAIAIGFLFGVLVVLIVALFVTKFKLNRLIGFFLIGLYVLYVIFELFIRPAVLDEE